MDSNHKSKKYTKVLNEYAGICRINLRERKFIAIIREYIRRKFYFFHRRVQDMNTAIIHTNIQMDLQDKTGENRHE